MSIHKFCLFLAALPSLGPLAVAQQPSGTVGAIQADVDRMAVDRATGFLSVPGLEQIALARSQAAQEAAEGFVAVPKFPLTLQIGGGDNPLHQSPRLSAYYGYIDFAPVWNHPILEGGWLLSGGFDLNGTAYDGGASMADGFTLTPTFAVDRLLWLGPGEVVDLTMSPAETLTYVGRPWSNTTIVPLIVRYESGIWQPQLTVKPQWLNFASELADPNDNLRAFAPSMEGDLFLSLGEAARSYFQTTVVQVGYCETVDHARGSYAQFRNGQMIVGFDLLPIDDLLTHLIYDFSDSPGIYAYPFRRAFILTGTLKYATQRYRHTDPAIGFLRSDIDRALAVKLTRQAKDGSTLALSYQFASAESNVSGKSYRDNEVQLAWVMSLKL